MRSAIANSSPAAEAAMPAARQGVAVAAVLSAMALVVLDAGMVNVALPAMAWDFGVSPGHSILVVTAYQAALVMALLPSAAIGGRYGERRVFVAGVGVFTAASLLCAASPGLPWLVAARFVQGLGGAAVMALGISLIRHTVAAPRLGAAIGWNAMTVALAAAAGPAIGAVILAIAGWPWLFAINLPLGAAALLVARGLPRSDAGHAGLDPISIALNAAAFGLSVTGAELVAEQPLVAVGVAMSGLAAFAGLVRRESPKAAPMAPLDLLRLRPFRLSVIASVLCFSGQTLALVALPFHLQALFASDLAAIGLSLTAWPLSVAAMALVAGRLSDRIPNHWLCAAGGIGLAVGLGLISVWPAQANHGLVLAFTSLCGLGFGMFQTPNNRTMFLSAPSERSAAAGGLQGTARLTGQTTGAVMVTLLFGWLGAAAAPRAALAMGALLALAAAGVSLLQARPLPLAMHRT